MFKKLFIAMILVSVSAVAAAKDDFPPVSHDGLHLVPDTKLRAV